MPWKRDQTTTPSVASFCDEIPTNVNSKLAWQDHPEDVAWQSTTHRIQFIVDNQMVAKLMSGSAVLSDASYRPVFVRMGRNVVALLAWVGIHAHLIGTSFNGAPVHITRSPTSCAMRPWTITAILWTWMRKAYGGLQATETSASTVTAAAETLLLRLDGSCEVSLQDCMAKSLPESQLSCLLHVVLFVQKFLHSIMLWKSFVPFFVPILRQRERRMQRQFFKPEFKNHAGRPFL